MSRADRERWDAKYAAGDAGTTPAPDTLLVQHAHLLTGGGLALDLACGLGQNAGFLARRGYQVLGVDISLAGLRRARAALGNEAPAVQLVAADLDCFAPPPGQFAAVIVFRFLSRALVPSLKAALTPGGLLIYQTFNLNRGGMRPGYLLQRGELARLFADFDTLATNDTADNTDEQSWWIGRRPP